MPRMYCDDNQQFVNMSKDYDLHVFLYMHILFLLLYFVIAALIVTSILIGLYISHKETMKAIRPPHVECPRTVHHKDGATMTEGMNAEQRPEFGTIYMTRAGSVYHTNPDCDQGGNFAPMYAKRRCLLRVASSGRRG